MRIGIVAATVVAIVAIGITIWFQIQSSNPPAPAGAVEAPPHYDTTGGQEMRPRWDSSGGHSDDETGN